MTFNTHSLAQLKKLCKNYKTSHSIVGYSRMRKDELIQMLELRFAFENGVLVSVQPVAVTPIVMAPAKAPPKAPAKAPKAPAKASKAPAKAQPNAQQQAYKQSLHDQEEPEYSPQRLAKSQYKAQSLPNHVRRLYSQMVLETVRRYEPGREGFYMARPRAFYRKYPMLFVDLEETRRWKPSQIETVIEMIENDSE
jgi:hypothetical protein